MSDWTIIGISSTIISVLFGLLGYFVHRWVSGLDESIKELRDEVVDVKVKMASTLSGMDDIKIGNNHTDVNVNEGLEKISVKITFQGQQIQELTSRVAQTDSALARYGILLKEIVKRITKEKAP